MCLNNINFPPVANRYRNFLSAAITSEVTNRTSKYGRLGIVRVSFRHRVNHIHNLNLAPTLIITSTNSKIKKSLTSEVESRTEGSRPRPRTKDTRASALLKKKFFTKIFQAISRKKRLPKNFSGATQNFNNSKNSAVLEPRTGQFLRT